MDLEKGLFEQDFSILLTSGTSFWKIPILLGFGDRKI